MFGLIGLGNMGRPIATNIVAAGFELVGYDMAGTADRLPPGATEATSIADVCERVDTVLLSVPDGKATIAIARDIAAVGSPPVEVVIDLSTIGPQAAQAAATVLAPTGITYTDGPVSGGVTGAIAGTIAMMFSGPTVIFEKNRALCRGYIVNGASHRCG